MAAVPLSVKPLGGDVYWTQGGAGGNTGIIIGKDGVIVVDAKTTPDSARQVLAEIAKRVGRKALEDPLQAHRSVSEIAYGWGFSDMTHFGRRFKQAYGVLPSVYGEEPDCPPARARKRRARLDHARTLHPLLYPPRHR